MLDDLMDKMSGEYRMREHRNAMNARKEAKAKALHNVRLGNAATGKRKAEQKMLARKRQTMVNMLADNNDY